MGFKHLFKAQAKWSSNGEEGTLNPRRYSRNHTIDIEGKEVLNVSAAAAFKGAPDLHNPEDMLLSSVVSCHMLSYFYLCAQNGIEVLEYLDNAEATLELESDGSGRFSEVRLYPRVTVRKQEIVEKALKLHKRANELCFIANSCNFPILHFPTCDCV